MRDRRPSRQWERKIRPKGISVDVDLIDNSGRCSHAFVPHSLTLWFFLRCRHRLLEGSTLFGDIAMSVLTSKFAGIFRRLIGLPLFLAITVANARDDAPPSSVRPWAPPALPRYEGELRQYQPTEAERRYYPAINPQKTYNLAELIDIAQRSNPETRVAWERARQAAAAVGLTESAYYPYIVAAAAGGYDRAFIPFPTLRVKQQTPPTNGNLPNVEIVGGGTLITESLLARAELNAKWLLLDFGERKATTAAAREQLMMANVGFNGTHQKIVFDVTDRFYQLGNARQKVMVTQSALDAAKTVEQAAQARFDNGLATKPELLQAQQQSAQSNFDVQASLGAESDARVTLIESIGLVPTVSLKVADLPEQSQLDAQSEDSG